MKRNVVAVCTFLVISKGTRNAIRPSVGEPSDAVDVLAPFDERQRVQAAFRPIARSACWLAVCNRVDAARVQTINAVDGDVQVKIATVPARRAHQIIANVTRHAINVPQNALFLCLGLDGA